MQGETTQQTKNRQRALLSVFLILASAVFYADRVSAAEPQSHHLKAVFLNSFIKFIEWPASAFKNNNSSVTICVMGDNPFGRVLDLAVADSNKKRKGFRTTQVRYIKVVEQLESCHILYLSSSEMHRSSGVLDHIYGKPILTVSDMQNFIALGGMIQFYNEGKKVRFFIKPRAIRATGLGLFGSLLRFAKIVSDD